MSTTATFVNGTLPVFVTRNEYVTVAPAVVTAVGDAVLAIVSAGLCVAVTVAVAGVDVVGPPTGFVPFATAESLIVPFVRSACVTV